MAACRLRLHRQTLSPSPALCRQGLGPVILVQVCEEGLMDQEW